MRRSSLPPALVCTFLLVFALMLGCAGDLIVRAPETFPLADSGALGRLTPLSVSVGNVSNVPDMNQSVGQRGAAPLQPGGPIHLTEDTGTIVRRTVLETLRQSGHRIVANYADSDAHVSLRVDEFTVDAPREGVGWEVKVRVRLSARVSVEPGEETWDGVFASAERTLRTAWRPDVGTIEPVLRECLQDVGALLARRPELAAALAKHSARRRAR